MAKRVFIGVGHGGSDPGAVGKVCEADANLTISLEMKRILESYGFVVGISRTRDENDDLPEEINEANAFKPDLAFEVHNNAGGGDGFEVYVQTNSYAAKSKAAAKAVEARVKALGQKSRGIKTKKNSSGTADYFGWLRQVKAPAILTEGFFVDSNDALGFDTTAELKALANAYAQGVLDYFGVKGSESATATTKPNVTKPTANTTNTTRKVDYAKSWNKGYRGTYTVKANGGLNMRTGAGTSNEIIKTLKNGAKFTCYGYYTKQADGTIWLLGVDKNGVKGFCSKAYLV